MKKIKGLLVLLVGLLFLVSCINSKEEPEEVINEITEEVTIEVNDTLTLRVEEEVKLQVNHLAKDLLFEDMEDYLEIRISGDNVYVKAIKEGVVNLKVIYRKNENITATINVTVNPKLEPNLVSIVIRLISVPTNTYHYPIKLIGTMTNWNSEEALTFTKSGDYYDLTLQVDRNIENRFSIYIDKGQTLWYDYQASNDGFDAIPDWVITEEEYERHLIVISILEWTKLKPAEDIIIMSEDVSEHDPFHPDFKGEHKEELQALHHDIEEVYNVNIKYVPYPNNAFWGQSRVRAMIEAQINGKPLADIYYHLSPNWMFSLIQGEAISPVDEFLVPGACGENVPENVRNISTYNGKVYGFSPNEAKIGNGLYYNADIIERLGLDNPTELYLNGKWTWSKFKEWTLQAKKLIETDEAILGGGVASFAENLLPLNGSGNFVDFTTRKVTLNDPKMLETYAYVKELYDEGVFSKEQGYYGEIVSWQTGKVLFRPEQFIFINRWKDNINFELGFVPYPMNDSYKASGGEYKSLIRGYDFPFIANGMTEERKELVFKVWWNLQRKVSKEQYELEFRNSLSKYFLNPIYIDAYMDIYNKPCIDLLTGSDGRSLSNRLLYRIIDGTYLEALREIEPSYQYWLEYYLNVEMVEVTVRLANIPSTTGVYPIKLIGSMMDWNKEEALTFTKNGEYYEVKLKVDKNALNKISVYLDKGQTDWREHEASNDGINSIKERTISNVEYDVLLIIFDIPKWKGLE